MCNFSISFTGNPDDMLQKAKTTVESHGGTFNGDTNEGNFSIEVFGNSIAGTYTTQGNMLNVHVTDKPFFVPCATIESFLQSKIS